VIDLQVSFNDVSVFVVILSSRLFIVYGLARVFINVTGVDSVIELLQCLNCGGSQC